MEARDRTRAMIRLTTAVQAQLRFKRVHSSSRLSWRLGRKAHIEKSYFAFFVSGSLDFLVSGNVSG